MKTQRAAFTLVETLAVMAVLSAILGMLIMTLHGIRKTGSCFADGVAAADQRQRFAVRLRVDAHQARRATLKRADPEMPAVTLLELHMLDDQRVEYELREERILRRTRSGGKVVDRDAFRVRPVLKHGWSKDDQRAAPLLQVRLHQSPGFRQDREPTLCPVSVQAAVGVSAGPASGSSPGVNP